jgi:tetratricopeptide (TPR) repeat protein
MHRFAPTAFATSRRAALASLCALLCALLCAAATFDAFAGPAEDAVTNLQHEWDVIHYQVPQAEREQRFASLAARAHQVTKANPGRAEPLVWEGIILSSWAGEKGGLGALDLAKQAKGLYEQAIAINGDVLEGSAYDSLGVLYYKVPGWPIGFGDKAKARELLQKALAVNPQGIDPNFFYAEYLMETKQSDPLPFLQKALRAPTRPGREIADAGRRTEVRALLAKIESR